MAGERVDDARPEANALGVQRAERRADVDLAVERLRIGDADDVEVAGLGRPAPLHELRGCIGQKGDSEADLRHRASRADRAESRRREAIVAWPSVEAGEADGLLVLD